VTAGPVTAAAQPIAEVDAKNSISRPTGLGELDRVLGGGIVPGAVVLLTGEPGVGKSTLLLAAASDSATVAHRSLYITGEESAAQVRLRADRVGALRPNLLLAAENDLNAVIGHIEAVNPSLLVIDSVQTISSADVEGSAGGVTQVREVAAALIRVAKERGMAMILVGHVTKDGTIAGPRLLEHLVDVVLHVEGDRHGTLRMVRAIKNRYGPTDDIGCFEMREEGLVGLPDPSGLFLTRRAEPVAGTCVTVSLEGSRPMLVEVQALVTGDGIPSPRRATSGLDSSRVAMTMAVLEGRASVPLAKSEVYVATVGGVRVTEPATDLAVALSIAGAKLDKALPSNAVAFGEVGLGGEVRRVSGGERRLAEAARLGFTLALVPADHGKTPKGMQVIEIDDIREAVRWLKAHGLRSSSE
jgi:DNA repair protein RadA/Sms